MPSVTDPRSPTTPYLGAFPPSDLGYILGGRKTSVFGRGVITDSRARRTGFKSQLSHLAYSNHYIC